MNRPRRQQETAMDTQRPEKTQLINEPNIKPVDPGEGAGVPPVDLDDDPSVSPIDLADLTFARRPVEVASPVRSAKKKGLPVWAVALFVVLTLTGIGAGAWYTYDQELWGGHTVPSVVGLERDAAQKQLEAAGFKVTVEESAADDGIGTVLACDPEPGKRAETSGGATITVAIARTIPQVTGQNVDDAQKALLDAGAQNVRIQSVNSDAGAGTVVSVEPAEGSQFKSADEVVLSVATPYVVPSVVGLTADAAKAAVEKAGLQAKVDYIKSDKPHNEVVSCSPEAGTQAQEGDVVELKVSSPFPESPDKLAEYLDATSKEVATYLGNEKYALTYGATFSNGDAHAVYTGAAGDMITFTANPEVGSYAGDKTDDVLAAGAPISGVRYVFAQGSAPAGADAETVAAVKAVMQECGFTGLKESCSAADLEKLGFAAEGRHFICAYGEAQGYSWAVLIGGKQAGQVNVVAMTFLKGRFSGGIDLAPYGNSPAKFIAYAGLYNENAVVQKEAADAAAKDGAAAQGQ